MDRLYSLIHVKSVDDEQRIISGIATTPTPDRGDDVVEPSGVRFKNPLPFVLHHDKTKPVGHVTFHKATAAGVPFTAKIPMVAEPGVVKDRTDEAWHSAKYGLLRGVSIGYLPLKFDHRATGGRHLKEIEVLELSMVTVPMNAETTITAIKSLDAAALALSGKATSRETPAVAGSRVEARAMNVPISQQVADEQRDLKEKSDRLTDLMAKDAADAGLSDADAAERDTLTKTVEALAAKIARLRTLESAQAALATTAYQAPARPATKTADTMRVEMPKLEKGTGFFRYAMAIAAGKGSYSDTLQYARRWDGQTPEVSAYIKSTWGLDGGMLSNLQAIIAQKAIAGSAGLGSPQWGAELAFQNNLASEFVDLLRAQSIIGRLPGLRMVPFNVRVGVQTGGSTVNWVGEQGVKPVGELDFTEANLTFSKVAGIVVLSDELIRLSTPSAEQVVRTDLTAAVQEFIDQQLLDPNVSAGANNPASLTNGVAGTGASGTTAADFRSDLNTVILAPMDAANIDTASVVLLMPPAVARGIAALTNAFGAREFASMGPNGGSIDGFTVIVSNSVPSGNVIGVAANEVWLADDGQVTLDASNQATLDMAGSTSPNFSLWQRNCTAIRAERWIRWQKRRTAAVQRITSAAYAP